MRGGSFLCRSAAALVLFCGATFLAISATDSVRHDIALLSGVGIGVSGFLMAIVTTLGVVRLQQTGHIFGHHLSSRDAAMALALGHFASALIIQVIGQIAARTAWLARSGVPVMESALMYLIERMIAASVCFGLACIGAGWLFRSYVHDIVMNRTDVWMISAATGIFVCAAFAASWWLWKSQKIQYLIPENLTATVPVAGLTLLMQVVTFAAWMSLLIDLPKIDGVDLAAGVAIVIFGASIPIGIAGWGTREISAVAVLGLVGVPELTALSASIVIGLVSLAAISLIGILAAVNVDRRPDLGNSSCNHGSD